MKKRRGRQFGGSLGKRDVTEKNSLRANALNKVVTTGIVFEKVFEKSSLGHSMRQL